MHKSSYISLFATIAIVLGMVFLTTHQTSQYKSKWDNELILNFNGNVYTVSNKTTTDVSEKIGTVSYRKDGQVYDIFSIKNVSILKEIAVDTSSGFLIAYVNN